MEAWGTEHPLGRYAADGACKHWHKSPAYAPESGQCRALQRSGGPTLRFASHGSHSIREHPIRAPVSLATPGLYAATRPRDHRDPVLSALVLRSSAALARSSRTDRSVVCRPVVLAYRPFSSATEASLYLDRLFPLTMVHLGPGTAHFACRRAAARLNGCLRLRARSRMAGEGSRRAHAPRSLY